MKKIYLMYPMEIGTVSPEIYGHFTEHIGGVIYGGIWVGKNSDIPNIKGFRKDIVEKLKAIHAPVIRWPGGCFAEIYDWRDGIGENRPTRLNWWTNRDGKYESNAVGTHEFMDFCEAVGAKAYFAANLTTVSPLHIRNWMDYCLSPKGSTTLACEREANGHPEPFDIPYWGVGNENWGGGGEMTPQFYSDEFRRFATVLKNDFPNAELFACGEDAARYDWTHGFMRGVEACGVRFSGYAMHYYTHGVGEAIDFTEQDWDGQMKSAALMEDIIKRNWHIICGYGMENKARLVVDEWGCWHKENSGPSKGANLFEQQSTMRDAMVTALTFNIFNNHCDKVRMANAAQLVNNLHCLFLASGENCITTPTYHVFDLYQEHQGAKAIRTAVSGKEDDAELTVSASVKDGKTLVTVGNLSCKKDVTVSLESVGGKISGEAEAVLLYSEDVHAHNTFEAPQTVAPIRMDLDIRKPFVLPKAGILAIRFPSV